MAQCFVRAGLAIVLLATAACGHAQPDDPAAMESNMTVVEIVSGSRIWTAQIGDGPAERDFLAQLPLSLTLEDYAGTEKIATLPRPLSRADAPDVTVPRAGDVTFYAPWGNLAIFYCDGQRSFGLIRLGQLEGKTPDFGGDPLKVTIRRLETGR